MHCALYSPRNSINCSWIAATSPTPAIRSRLSTVSLSRLATLVLRRHEQKVRHHRHQATYYKAACNVQRVMHPKVHPAIAISRHPKHQTEGGCFFSPYQRKQQRTRHRIRRMTAHKTVRSATVSAHDVQHSLQRWLVRRTRTAHRMLDNARRDIVRTTYCHGKCSEYQQAMYHTPCTVLLVTPRISIPLLVFSVRLHAIPPHYQPYQHCIQRQPCSTLRDIPHQRVRPWCVPPVNSHQPFLVCTDKGLYEAQYFHCSQYLQCAVLRIAFGCSLRFLCRIHRLHSDCKDSIFV